MSNDNTQLRGHCQVCGRLQAVRNGRMAHHGYRVENGWFKGTCWGHHHGPMERDIEVTKSVLKSVGEQIVALRADVEALKAGKKHPATVQGHWDPKLRDYATIPWAEAPAYKRVDAVQAAIFENESRIRGGESFIQQMTKLMESAHGQPLVEVKRAEKAEPIPAGEVRISESGKKLTATYVMGARVQWKDERGYSSWTGTRAWRALKKAA